MSKSPGNGLLMILGLVAVAGYGLGSGWVQFGPPRTTAGISGSPDQPPPTPVRPTLAPQMVVDPNLQRAAGVSPLWPGLAAHGQVPVPPPAAPEAGTPVPPPAAPEAGTPVPPPAAPEAETSVSPPAAPKTETPDPKAGESKAATATSPKGRPAISPEDVKVRVSSVESSPLDMKSNPRILSDGPELPIKITVVMKKGSDFDDSGARITAELTPIGGRPIEPMRGEETSKKGEDNATVTVTRHRVGYVQSRDQNRRPRARWSSDLRLPGPASDRARQGSEQP